MGELATFKPRITPLRGIDPLQIFYMNLPIAGAALILPRSLSSA